jgi:hypothetical protein
LAKKKIWTATATVWAEGFCPGEIDAPEEDDDDDF